MQVLVNRSLLHTDVAVNTERLSANVAVNLVAGADLSCQLGWIWNV